MKWFKKLILIYLIFVIIKTILSYFIPSPSAFSDEYIYAKMARSFYYFLNFDIHGSPSHNFLPLYPITLSLSYFFRDMQAVYFIMKFINSLLSSLILFPAWLIAKDFMPKRKSLFLAILISAHPSSFSFSPYLMAENLFYPLFLFTIYFIYKYFKEDSYQYAILSGLFLGLSFLTKITALILIPVLLLLASYKLIKQELNLKKISSIFIVFLIVISPWIIRNGLLFGFTLDSFLGGYVKEVSRFSPYNFSIWVILYIGFIILASGVLFAIFAFSLFKNKKTHILFLLFFLVTFALIMMGANHNAGEPNLNSSYISGRPIGRYVDTNLPLLLILGFIGLNFYKNQSFQKLFLLLLPFITLSSLLVLFPLFPVNNMSLTWLGLLNSFLEILISNVLIRTIIIAIILILMSFFIYKYILNLNPQKIVFFFIIFFALLSISNYIIIYYNSDTYWYQNEQMQLGIWFNDFDKETSKILIDQRDCTEKITKLNQYNLCDPAFSPIGFWLNDEIKIGEPSSLKNFNYLISRHNFPLEIIKETGSGIKIYKTL